MADICYKTLLKKFIKHVELEEGVSFVPPAWKVQLKKDEAECAQEEFQVGMLFSYPDPELTLDDIEELQKLDQER